MGRYIYKSRTWHRYIFSKCTITIFATHGVEAFFSEHHRIATDCHAFSPMLKLCFAIVKFLYCSTEFVAQYNIVSMIYGSIGNTYVCPANSGIMYLDKNIALRCQYWHIGIFYISDGVIYNFYCSHIKIPAGILFV